MEFLDKLAGWIEKIHPKNEDLNTWKYEEFRRYILSVARNPCNLLSVERYPLRIQLSGNWHALFSQMKEGSRDGHERYAIICSNLENQSIFLPTQPTKGISRTVPADVQKAILTRAKEQGFKDAGLGFIHSHPVLSRYSFAIFSAIDLFNIVKPMNDILLMGLVQGDSILFVFKTQEFRDTGLDPSIFGWDTFARYWYAQYGYNIDLKERIVTAITPTADEWRMNLEIARRHALVFYRGVIGQDLQKVNS